MKTVESYPGVEDLLYHDHPMILIDKMVEINEEGAVSEVVITDGRLFMKNGKIPAYVGIEYMAQTIGLYAGAANFDMGLPPDIGFLLGGQEISLYCDFYKQGQVLKVVVKKIWDGLKLVQFECSVFDKKDNTLLMNGNINVYSPSREL
jgi:predicted hotdog family 3-hydroxylacyl-ACP dehydratase